MLDPTITGNIATPIHPSYPSAHGCLAAGGALIAEVSEARIAGGTHVRSDQLAGEAIGRHVAGVVVARAGATN